MDDSIRNFSVDGAGNVIVQALSGDYVLDIAPEDLEGASSSGLPPFRMSLEGPTIHLLATPFRPTCEEWEQVQAIITKDDDLLRELREHAPDALWALQLPHHRAKSLPYKVYAGEIGADRLFLNHTIAISYSGNITRALLTCRSSTGVCQMRIDVPGRKADASFSLNALHYLTRSAPPLAPSLG